MKTGARGLRGILEKILLNLMYEIPSEDSLEFVEITKDVVDGKKDMVNKRYRDSSFEGALN